MSTTETTAPTTRTIDGRLVPAAGTWTVDTSHSQVEFVGRHLVVTKVRGRFTDYEVALTVAERPEDSTVAVTIQAGSITSGDESRDGHLTSPDFLDVETHPTITFASTSVAPRGDVWEVTGELTIVGVTRTVVLEVTFGGVIADPWGNSRAMFSAETQIDREDFGLTWNQPLAGGGLLVGKQVKIELDVEALPA